MKNNIKIGLALLFNGFFSVAVASPFGVMCDRPVIAEVIRDTIATTFNMTCTNNTPATFSAINFTAHSLSGSGMVNVAAITNMRPGQTVTTQGSITLNHSGYYIFDFDLNYGGATHPGVLCKNNPTASNCMVFTAEDPSFLVLSDIHYGKGDTDESLWVNAQAEAQQLITKQKLKFVLLLGDLPAHGGDATSRSNNVQKVLHDLSSSMTIPVYYIPGNNDALGGNYHSFTNANHQTPLSLDSGKNWPTLNVSQSCSAAASAPCTLDMGGGASFGYYSALPAANLRLIALNSVIFSDRYVSDDGVSQTDATNQELNWLDTQLSDAETQHQTAIVAMHIPFGLDAYSDKSMWQSTDALARFLSIISNHQAIIKGIYSGHTHMDEIRRLYDTNKNLAALDISTPGITPDHANNPAMKTFAYDPNNFNLTDVFTYYTTTNQSSVWQMYSFRQDYACGAQNIFFCARGFSTQDKKFTDIYDYNYSARNPNFPAQPLGWQGIWDAIDVFA